MNQAMRRLPRVPDKRVERQKRELYVWQNFIDGRRVFDDADTGGVDLIVVLAYIISVRKMYLCGYEAFAARHPKEGKGSRRAKHVASGCAQAWGDAGATLIKEFSMAVWRERVTYDHEGECRYWPYNAEGLLRDVEEMLENIGWVFALQKLLGGKPGSGKSYEEK